MYRKMATELLTNSLSLLLMTMATFSQMLSDPSNINNYVAKLPNGLINQKVYTNNFDTLMWIIANENSQTVTNTVLSVKSDYTRGQAGTDGIEFQNYVNYAPVKGLGFLSISYGGNFFVDGGVIAIVVQPFPIILSTYNGKTLSNTSTLVAENALKQSVLNYLMSGNHLSSGTLDNSIFFSDIPGATVNLIDVGTISENNPQRGNPVYGVMYFPGYDNYWFFGCSNQQLFSEEGTINDNTTYYYMISWNPNDGYKIVNDYGNDIFYPTNDILPFSISPGTPDMQKEAMIHSAIFSLFIFLSFSEYNNPPPTITNVPFGQLLSQYPLFKIGNINYFTNDTLNNYIVSTQFTNQNEWALQVKSPSISYFIPFSISPATVGSLNYNTVNPVKNSLYNMSLPDGWFFTIYGEYNSGGGTTPPFPFNLSYVTIQTIQNDISPTDAYFYPGIITSTDGVNSTLYIIPS